MTTLQSIRSAAQKELPDVNIENHPFDIGYWAQRARLKIPNRLNIEGGDLGEFRAGWEQSKTEGAAPS